MSKPLRRVLLVDDEAPARTNLRLALAAHPGWQVVSEAADAVEARAVIGSGSIDLVFVDVQMPGEDGMRLARSLAALPDPPIVVFVTAFDAYAVDAFEARALDYLLKPFDDERLALTLERAAQLLDLQQRAQYAGALRELADDREAEAAGRAPERLRSLSVKSVRRIERVAIDALIWVGSAGNYVELHVEGRCLLHRVAMAWMEQRLDPAEFMRVHRKAIVRRSAIRGFASSEGEGPVLLLSNGDRVAVSPRHLAAVRALFD